MQLLAELLKEAPTGKDSQSYRIFRDLDALFNDRLIPLCERCAIPATPEIQRTANRLLEDISTACRFPEMCAKPTCVLRVPHVAEAFKGVSCGLIEPITELSYLYSEIPVLATNGPGFKLEYVNYCDSRREITLGQLKELLAGARVDRYNLKLRRVIKNFVLTAPEVTPDSNIAIIREWKAAEPEGGTSTRKQYMDPFRYRIGSFVCREFAASRTAPVDVLPGTLRRNYLGLREISAYIRAGACSGCESVINRAEQIEEALTLDKLRTRDDAENELSFLNTCRSKEESRIRNAKQLLGTLEPVLDEIDDKIPDLVKLMADFPQGKNIPRDSHAVNCLYGTITLAIQTGKSPQEHLHRLDELGQPQGYHQKLRQAVEAGKRCAAIFLPPDTGELLKNAESGFSKMRELHPRMILRLNTEFFTEYKVAAALGDRRCRREALKRMAELLYEARRQDYELQCPLTGVKLEDAIILLNLCRWLKALGVDDNQNRERIRKLDYCIGNRKRSVSKNMPNGNAAKVGLAVAEIKIPESVKNIPTGMNIPFEQIMQEQKRVRQMLNQQEDFSKTRENVHETTSFGCFVVTATVRALGHSRWAVAKTLCLMRHLHDLMTRSGEDDRRLLEAYREEAPRIVETIDGMHDSKRFYKYLWARYISRCRAAVISRDLADARRIYMEMMRFIIAEINYPVSPVVAACLKVVDPSAKQS